VPRVQGHSSAGAAGHEPGTAELIDNNIRAKKGSQQTHVLNLFDNSSNSLSDRNPDLGTILNDDSTAGEEHGWCGCRTVGRGSISIYCASASTLLPRMCERTSSSLPGARPIALTGLDVDANTDPIVVFGARL
jgi:hypothetical protein